MRKGVIAAAVLLAAAGAVAAGYCGARDVGETRLRDTMNTLAAGAATFADVRYGEAVFDPLARRATVNDIVVSWQSGDVKIGRTILEDVAFGQVDPRHGRIEFRDVTDDGFLNALLASIAQRGSEEAFVPLGGAWSRVRYDLAVEYDYDAGSRSLTIGKFEWSAPDWGDLVVRLDLTNLPGSLHLPELPKTGPLNGPIGFLGALVDGLPDLNALLIRGAALTYRDHGAINRMLDGLSAETDARDPQVFFLDLRDALQEKIAHGKAAVWDQALLELILGKADIDVAVAPKSPIPLARIMRLPDDGSATAAALGLKIVTAGKRDLGHFAITEAEERVLRARPFIEAGEVGLTMPDVPSKLSALSQFQQALVTAPGEPRAATGLDRAIAALLAEGAKREQVLEFVGDEGAEAIYRAILRQVPASQEAGAALTALPQHIAAAAVKAAGDEAPAAADTALDLLHMATRLDAQNPAVKEAAGPVAERLVKEGDRLASFGAYVSEGGNDGALTYYAGALAVKPDSDAALQALNALAERLKQVIAQQVFNGDKAGAAARIELIKVQWPSLAGRAELAEQLAALLTPPAPKGPVAVYNWSDYIGEFTNARFQQKTGIAVQYDVFDSSETLEAKLLAGNSGYDVVVPNGGFLARQIPAGRFKKLDKSRLPNLENLDPALMKASEAFDPGHEYSVPYMWGTIGIGYNVAAIKKRMPDAPVDSWRLVLDPKVVSKFKGCGVAIVDAPSDVLLAVLVYLGRDVNTASPEDYAAAQGTLAAIRPFVRYFHASSYINDIANGEICLAIGWNGDFAIAQSRADQARNRIKLRYVVPKEGTLIWMDSLAIPADAPHPNAALAYIDYLLDPQVAANNANYVRYASPNKAAVVRGLINAADLNNPAIYPPRPVMERLASDKLASPEVDRLRMQAWTAIKSGE
ncbi:polyamine ABC transporter substrate-binding protein [Dongia sedimenti]|uniref:Polyamine ABC transporter substrate-binding protein n=1 Tax=Dongia sedimenti TaxID=3064282 RepID=A0ABU0YG27_9PROT|nr:polyamine ABC transporter substrate-binding protein [Rhodospirillaceae bacterium R-7]